MSSVGTCSRNTLSEISCHDDLSCFVSQWFCTPLLGSIITSRSLKHGHEVYLIARGEKLKSLPIKNNVSIYFLLFVLECHVLGVFANVVALAPLPPDTMTSRAGGLYGGIQFSGKSLPPSSSSSQQYTSPSASSTPHAPISKPAIVQTSVVQQTDTDSQNQATSESTAVTAKPSAGISICPP